MLDVRIKPEIYVSVLYTGVTQPDCRGELGGTLRVRNGSEPVGLAQWV